MPDKIKLNVLQSLKITKVAIWDLSKWGQLKTTLEAPCAGQ